MLQSALSRNSGTFEVNESERSEEKKVEIKGGVNILFYGVPGSGKSYIIDSIVDTNFSERVVFHPDYTYSDFVGQILPRLINGKITYVFEPGPFTKMIEKAYNDTDHMYYLIIEEINRGNAAAIFGDIFQLLDRDEDGTGKYSISNYDISSIVFGDDKHFIKMPSNLSIYATMNTSDQNVFTIDTAFQRRWEMHLIPNNIDNSLYSNEEIEGSNITWGVFAKVTNNEIMKLSEDIGSSSDKRLGAYFVRKTELKRNKFPEKVLKYLWDDAFKMDHHVYFNEDITSFDKIIEIFNDNLIGIDPLKKVLCASVYENMNKKTELDLKSSSI